MRVLPFDFLSLFSIYCPPFSICPSWAAQPPCIAQPGALPRCKLVASCMASAALAEEEEKKHSTMWECETSCLFSWPTGHCFPKPGFPISPRQRCCASFCGFKQVRTAGRLLSQHFLGLALHSLRVTVLAIQPADQLSGVALGYSSVGSW